MSTIPIRLAYRLPPAFPQSDVDAERLAHQDLANMDRDELNLELGRVKLARMFGSIPSAWAATWLKERQRRIERLLKGGAA
jgi:hypothetical protein